MSEQQLSQRLTAILRQIDQAESERQSCRLRATKATTELVRIEMQDIIAELERGGGQ